MSIRSQVRHASARSVARTGLLALVGALLLAALVTGPQATAARAASDPGQDVPTLPVKCGGGGDYLMPQNRGVCKLKQFHREWPTVLVWGDSHAWQFTPALRKLTSGLNINLVAFARGGCPPMELDEANKDDRLTCVISNNDALAYVKRLSQRTPALQVILSANWVTYRDAWIRDEQGQPQPEGQEPYVAKMAALAKDGIPRLMATLGAIPTIDVDVVSSVLRVPDSPPPCYRGEDPYSCDMWRSAAIPREKSTGDWLLGTMQPLKDDARLIDVNDYVCGAFMCHGMVKDVHTFFDPLHISATMSRKMAGYFAGSIPASS